MKDIVITSKGLMREALLLLVCLLGGVAVDVYAIIKYSRPFSELFQTLGYAVAIGLAIYFIVMLLRLLGLLIRIIFAKKDRSL